MVFAAAGIVLADEPAVLPEKGENLAPAPGSPFSEIVILVIRKISLIKNRTRPVFLLYPF